MVKGDIIKDVSIDEIIQGTAGGWNIFKHYSPVKVGKTMHVPWRKDENRSFGVFCKNGVYFYKDLAQEEAGSSIHFVAKLFNISYTEAVEKIKWDFNIGQGKNINTSPVQIVWNKPEEDAEYTHIAFTSCPFDSKHASYWNAYHLSEDYLKKWDVYRLKTLSINRKRVFLPEETLNFAYYHSPSKCVKILRIGGEKTFKWKNNVSGDVLWFKEKLEECNKLVISKSVKDSLCLSLFGINTVAVQSESISCIDKNAEWFQTLSCPIFVNMGTDKQGKGVSNAITKKYKWKHYNTPDSLLPSVNDVAEWCKTDIKALEEHLKLKKIL